MTTATIKTPREGKFRRLFRDMKRERVCYLMVAPFLILFTLMILLPILAAAVLSFTDFNMLETPRFIGIDNYVRMFLNDELFLLALKKTLILAIITGPVGYVLSFVCAWFINELRPKSRAFLTMVMYAPSLTGASVYTVWKMIFSSDRYGILNSLLINLNLINTPIQWLLDSDYAFGCVVVVTVWMSMGVGFLSIIAGLQSLDRTYFEAAAIDGVKNRWQELIYVTLPQMGPQLIFAAVMSISGSFAIGYQCIALTGLPSTDYVTHTLLVHIIDYGSKRFEMGYASAVSVILFLIMILSWKIIQRVLSRLTNEQ